jgi:NAD(P)-dependent dehydrogenase (short-subunit alcohol dehydrogenase family)
MTEIATVLEPPLKTPDMRLDGQVAVVTGAGRGLGRACACAVAGAGAETVLISRTLSDLEAVAAEIETAGGTAHIMICDVSDVGQIADRIGSLDRINVLINNAGTNAPQDFIDVTEKNYDTVMDLNVKSALFVAQAVSRKMIDQGTGGSIIHMSSQMGHVGSPTRSVYCTSKHAIEGLNKAMAVELATHNIRVNAIAPTYVETAMTAPNFADPVFRADALSRIPLGRIGQLDEIMGAIVFLASPASGLITGASLTIDGGWTAQ